MLARWLPTGCILGIVGLSAFHRRIRLTVIDTLIALWMVYYMLRVCVGAEHACATQFLKCMSSCLLYFCLRGLYSVKGFSPLWLLAGIMLCGCYEAGIGITQLLNGSSRHHLYPVTGSFLNPGPYAAYLMIGCIATWEMKRLCRSKLLCSLLPYFCIIFLILILITQSRAALMGLAVYAMVTHRHQLKAHRWPALAGCIAATVVLYWLKQGSADGRLLTWWGALTSWTDSPWLGCGAGSFAQACGVGISSISRSHPQSSLWASAGVAEYACNDPLLLLVEQGVAGLTLGTLTLGGIFYSLKKGHTALRWIAVSLCVFSLFSYPFGLHSYRIIMVMLAVCSCRWAPGVTARSRWAILVLAILIPSGWWLRHSIEARSEADWQALTLAGMRHPAYIEDFYRYYPMELDNPSFLFAFGKTLREGGRFQDSNAILQVGGSVSADPMFKVVIGNNHRDMGHFRHAEHSYQEAYNMMPNRIYPLYQLMLLYRHTGHRELCRSTARKILATKPKIDSPAVREMTDSATIYAK